MSEQEKKAELPRSGWPRPVVDGWPVPWVSPVNELASMSKSRFAAAATGAVCAVCGEGYQEDELAIALVNEPPARAEPDGPWTHVQAMDNAVMHDRCARLSLRMCPRLIALRSQGVLLAVRAKAHECYSVEDESGTPRATFEAADVRQVELESLL